MVENSLVRLDYWRQVCEGEGGAQKRGEGMSYLHATPVTSSAYDVGTCVGSYRISI